MKEKEENGVVLREACQYLSGPSVHAWHSVRVPPSLLSHSPSLFFGHITPHSLSFFLLLFFFSFLLRFFFSLAFLSAEPDEKKNPDNHHRAISLGRSTHAAILSSSLLLPRLRSSSYPEPKLRARHSSQDRARDRREPPRAPPARRHR